MPVIHRYCFGCGNNYDRPNKIKTHLQACKCIDPSKLTINGDANFVTYDGEQMDLRIDNLIRNRKPNTNIEYVEKIIETPPEYMIQKIENVTKENEELLQKVNSLENINKEMLQKIESLENIVVENKRLKESIKVYTRINKQLQENNDVLVNIIEGPQKLKEKEENAKIEQKEINDNINLSEDDKLIINHIISKLTHMNEDDSRYLYNIKEKLKHQTRGLLLGEKEYLIGEEGEYDLNKLVEKIKSGKK